MTKKEFIAMSLPYKLAISVISPFNSEKRFEEWLTAMNYDQHYKTVTSKPILHPLSDLTKEIEHKGEKFVPITILKEMNDGDYIYISEFGVSIDNGYAAGYNLNIAFTFIQKLIEWHFDIAGLIEKGEAIDVNTLSENPYK